MTGRTTTRLPAAPGKPVPCTELRLSDRCFPGVGMNSFTEAAEAIGASCRREEPNDELICIDSSGEDHAVVRLQPTHQLPDKIACAVFSGWVRGDPDTANPHQRARKHLNAVMRAGLPILLPDAPEVPPQIIAWVEGMLGHCTGTIQEPGTIVWDYQIRCSKDEPITVNYPEGRITTWSVTAKVFAPLHI